MNSLNNPTATATSSPQPDKLGRGKGQAAMHATKTGNPSPSNDPWWDDPDNVALVERGAEEIRMGLGKRLSREDIRRKLGL